MQTNYQICLRCIMDTTMPNIHFDEKGICNYCKDYDELVKNRVYQGKSGKQKLSKLIDDIRKKGKRKAYDCVLGLSGGADSSYVACKVKEFGLRPLVVHVDNSWNTEMAVNNIEKLVKTLQFDLYTYVIDWEEFKDLQLAFLKASVANIEVLTDHAIRAAIYDVAAKQNVRYIISGSNTVTEGIMPRGWGYNHMDLKHIRSIHKKFGTQKLKTFPQLSVAKYIYVVFIKKMIKVNILNYLSYVKKDAIDYLKNEMCWKPYGGKHYESRFTRFFQGYILPRKFNFDKRRAHLSTMICSSQITREEALEEMARNPYPSEELMNEDKEFFLKKLALSPEEFEKIMNLPVKTHLDYPFNQFLFKVAPRILKIAKGFGFSPSA